MAEEYAFPEQRKEPLTDAPHVRNAVARFNQVEGVRDLDRDLTWKTNPRCGEEVRRPRVRERLA